VGTKSNIEPPGLITPPSVTKNKFLPRRRY